MALRELVCRDPDSAGSRERGRAPSLPALPGFVRVQALTKPVPHATYGITLGDGEAEPQP